MSPLLYAYSPFGRTVVKDPAGQRLAASAVGNPYGFTARRFDAETGLYYYRSRYYDPSIGRFLSRDIYPGNLRDPGELVNKYAYVTNNPVKWVDPWGLCKEWQQYGYSSEMEFLMAGGGGLQEDFASIYGISLIITLTGEYYFVIRTYWQYYPKGDSNYSSPWLTKGNRFRPPYKTGKPAQEALNLPTKRNSGTAVRKVPKPIEVVGPRTPKPKPQWGWPNPGTGQEYFKGPVFPD